MSGTDNVDEKTRPSRKRRGDGYARYVVKQSRVTGQAYINYKGNVVPSKKMGTSCGCNKECLGKIPQPEKEDVFRSFYNMNTKDEQDAFLQGLLEIQDVKRRRKRRKEDSKMKTKHYTIYYYIPCRGQRISVCKKALLALFAISDKRLRRISSLSVLGESPKDMRGHNPRSIPGEISDLLEVICSEPQ